MPPLRERREDVPLLLEHFVALYSRKHGVEIRGVSGQALRALQRHSWTGNVRELEKLVSRAVIMAPGGRIEPYYLGVLGADEPTIKMTSSANRNGVSRPRLNLRQQEALRIARVDGSVRRADLTTRFGISEQTARRDLAALVSAGLLSRKVARGISCYTQT
ncbi:MAG: DeoR family transcriptional regulator [Nitrospiraceae bacterium]